MKKAIRLVSLFVSIYLLIQTAKVYGQTQPDLKLHIYSVDSNGELQMDTYSRAYPKNYQDAIKLVESLVDIVNDTNYQYSQFVVEHKKVMDLINEDLNTLQKQNDELAIAIKEKDKLVKQRDILKNSAIFNKYFASIGIVGEYGFLGDGDTISAKIGVKLWRFTLCGGPSICIPRNIIKRDPQYGFVLSIGYWF